MNKDLFFEILDYEANTKKYIAAYGTSDGANRSMTINLFHRADRIWAHDSTGVYFIKNRSSRASSFPDADLKEFFWVKLKSVAL